MSYMHAVDSRTLAKVTVAVYNMDVVTTIIIIKDFVTNLALQLYTLEYLAP